MTSIGRLDTGIIQGITCHYIISQAAKLIGLHYAGL
jgi:hypothetical protein